MSSSARGDRIEFPGGVELRFTSRAYAGGRRPFDHDWLHAELVVRDQPTQPQPSGSRESSSGFRCSAFLRADDIAKFASVLAAGARSGRFAPTEPYLVVEFDGDQFAITAREVGTQRVVRRRVSWREAERQRVAEQVQSVASTWPPRGPIP